MMEIPITYQNKTNTTYTVLFVQVSPTARRLAMVTADSPGPSWQIEFNTPAARRPIIE